VPNILWSCHSRKASNIPGASCEILGRYRAVEMVGECRVSTMIRIVAHRFSLRHLKFRSSSGGGWLYNGADVQAEYGIRSAAVSASPSPSPSPYLYHTSHSDHSDPRRPSAWPNSLTVGLRPADFPQTVAERSPQIPWKAPGTVGENGRPHRSGRGGRFYDD